MATDIKLITLPMMLGSTVNCYLVHSRTGCALIDTGSHRHRAALLQAIAEAGCTSGKLNLVVLTHGDSDHSGNAAFLRRQFGAFIAMHDADLGMVTQGDMFWNRKRPKPLVGAAARLLFAMNKVDWFTPDVRVSQGDTLAEYGLNASIVELPGHSRGSIGVLTADGDLFCGDLLLNVHEPQVNSMLDDAQAVQASVEKLNSLPVKWIYPGHGLPFTMEQFTASMKARSMK